MSESDRTLLERIASGDAGAMRALYDRHATPLFRYALGRTGNPGTAEDAVQETMLAAWQGAAGYRGEARVRTWLFGICRNKLAEQAKRAGRREAPAAGRPADLAALTDLGATAPAGQDTVERQAQGAIDFWRAFGRLSEEHREVVLLVFHYGFTQQETADILGIPEGTAKSRVHHARRRLRAALAEEGAGHGRES